MLETTVEQSRFARLYDEEVGRVYGFFGYRLGARGEAEDLTQQTFERALKAWHRYDERRGSKRTWLMSIARNLLVDHFRRRPQELRIAGSQFEEEIDARSTESGDIGISVELANAIGTLRPREREIIALRYGGDLRGPEIADVTGLSVANVQQILSRSLRSLRGQLAPVLGATG